MSVATLAYRPRRRRRSRPAGIYGSQFSDFVLLGLFVVLCAAHGRIPGTPAVLDDVRSIAPGSLILTTSAVAIVGTLAWLILSRDSTYKLKDSRYALIFIIYALIMLQSPWTADRRTLAGVVHLLLGLLCYGLGCTFGRRLRKAHFQFLMTSTTMMLTLVFALSTAFQFGDADRRYADRTTSIFGHPAELGKIFVALLVLLLPASRSKDPIVRRMAMASIIMGSFAVVATLSRANILGVALMLVVFPILAGGRKITAAGLLMGTALVASLGLFVSDLAARVASDPNGGQRPELWRAGLRSIGDHWLVGTGPNNYVTMIGQENFIIRSIGAPVHNTHLLGFTELGVAGYVLLMVPFLIVGWRAVKIAAASIDHRYRARRPGQLWAASFVAFLLALAPITWTGWGAFLPPTLYIYFLVCGVAGQQMIRSERQVGR